MYTAIKQAVEQYVDHEYETTIDPQKLDYEHERMWEFTLQCAESLTLDIFELWTILKLLSRFILNKTPIL